MILRHLTLNPVSPVSPVMASVDRLFDTLTNAGTCAANGHVAPFVPAMNIWQNDTSYIVEAELPGFKMNEIEVSLLQNRLTISGRHAEQMESNEQGEYIRRERRVGEFSRTITVPSQIDSERIEAHLDHGVLRVTLPKAQAAQPRRIEVRPSAS